VAEEGRWNLDNAGTVLESVQRVAGRLYSALPSEILGSERRYVLLAKDVFRTFFSGLPIVQMPFGTLREGWYAQSHERPRSIDLAPPEDYWTTRRTNGLVLVAHELGHIFSFRQSSDPWQELKTSTGNAQFPGAPPQCEEDEWTPPKDNPDAESPCHNWHEGLTIGEWTGETVDELWADLFAAWVFNAFDLGSRYEVRRLRAMFLREWVWDYMTQAVQGEYLR
jgi:hypothetical protein